MYYMLEQYDPPDAFAAQVDYESDRAGRSWVLGRRFDPPMPEPVKATLRMRKKSVLLDMWTVSVPLMTKALHEALLGAGVSNIDVYEAELIDPKSGKIYTNYVAFNIIGAIDAADRAKSKIETPDGSLISADVDSLVIDESKARGVLMFRLAESVSGIVVHESVKRAIEAAGINVRFIRPENWMG